MTGAGRATVSTGAEVDAESCGGAVGNCATAIGTGVESCGDTGGACAEAFQPATNQPVNTAATRKLTREVTLEGGTLQGDEMVTAKLRMTPKGQGIGYYS